MEKWIQKEVGVQFDSLIEDMNQECSRIIIDAEKKISEVEKYMNIDAAERQTEERRLESFSRDVQTITEAIRVLQEELEKHSAEQEKEAIHA